MTLVAMNSVPLKNSLANKGMRVTELGRYRVCNEFRSTSELV
jgi:hypothetical protein